VSRVWQSSESENTMNLKKPIAATVAVAVGGAQLAESGAIDVPAAGVDLTGITVAVSTAAYWGGQWGQVAVWDTTNDNLYVSEPLPRKPATTAKSS
jgi:hypothetical protein